MENKNKTKKNKEQDRKGWGYQGSCVLKLMKVQKSVKIMEKRVRTEIDLCTRLDYFVGHFKNHLTY